MSKPPVHLMGARLPFTFAACGLQSSRIRVAALWAAVTCPDCMAIMARAGQVTGQLTLGIDGGAA